MEDLSRILDFPIVTLAETTITVGAILQVVALVLLGSIFVIWSNRFLKRRMQSRLVDPDLVQIISRAYLILGFVVLAFVTLDLLKVPLAAFAFVSGAFAIGIGFGAQNIINNFISGWILMWERPIKLGDFLELGDVRGTVEAINTRSTRIRRVDGVHLLVPNSYLLENTVTNWTLMDNLVRTSVVVGVAYGSDVALVKKLMEQAAAEHPDVLQEPQWAVIFDNFGDSSLVFELTIWGYSAAERGLRMIRSDLRYRIDELFRENDVVISFPQRDVHVDGQVRILSDQA